MENKYENKELCAKCGGICCKKGGCQYSPTDFESLKFEYLYEQLQAGYISIVCVVDFVNLKGKLIANPMLYVKSRNEGRPIIDLLSMRTKCSALTDTGCMYDFKNRPSGGKNLIPGGTPDKCYPEIHPLEFIKMWQPQQQVLRKLVKRINGRTVEAQLEIDTYNLFKDVLARKFDGIAPEEIENILGMLPMLSQVYSEATKKAIKEYRVLHPNDPILPKR